ncbi:MAG: hypothetical protein U0K39_04710 [Latilactobacillus curvatus]|nr:hypothetical protein [Latilactobacillus curvatus]
MLDGAVDDVLSLSHIDAPRAYGGIVLASVGEPYDVHSRPIKKMALILTQAILQVTQKMFVKNRLWCNPRGGVS